ncbi:putative chaperone DnaJ [Medicago truncatula]|nr:putative chaperone DnaJ [Medicago truncatula]
MGNEKSDMIPVDVIFVIAEKPHTLYTRNGDDLLIQQKITYVEALRGTVLKIPTLDGRSLSVTLPRRVTLGYEHKVPGEGMPLTKVPGRKGTLKITITDIKYF